MNVLRKRGRWYADFRAITHGVHGVLLLADVAPDATRDQAMAAAGRMLARLRVRSPQLELIPDAPATVAALVPLWLRATDFHTPATRKHYAQHAARAAADLGELAALSARAVEAAVERWREQGAGWKTRKHRLAAIRRALAWGVKQGYLPALPPWPSAPKGQRIQRDRWLPEAEFTKVLSCLSLQGRRSLGPRRLNFLHVSGALVWTYVTGQHATDVCDVRAGRDVADPQVGTYRVRNTKNARHLANDEAHWEPLPEVMLSLLREIAHARSGVATGEVWFPVTPDGINKALAAACKRAGVAHASLIDLRRSFCTLQALAGVPEFRTVFLMGHKGSARMVREVYRQMPRAWTDARARFAVLCPSVAQGAQPPAAQILNLASAHAAQQEQPGNKKQRRIDP